MLFRGSLVKPLVKFKRLPTLISVRHPEQFLLGIIKLDMSISVQRYGYVTVTHDVLQGFRAHSGLCHIGAEGMPAYMGRDLGQLYPVNLVILGYNMLHILFPMQCHHRHIIFVQEQESGATIHNRLHPRLFRLRMIRRKQASTSSVMGT